MDTMAAWKQELINYAQEQQRLADEKEKERAEEELNAKREQLDWRLRQLINYTGDMQMTWRGSRAVIDGVEFTFYNDGGYKCVQLVWTCPKCGEEEYYEIHTRESLGIALAADWVVPYHECKIEGKYEQSVFDDDEYTAPGHTHPITAAPAHLASQVDSLSKQLSDMDIRMARVEMFVLNREQQIRELEHALSMAWSDGDAAKALADGGDKSDVYEN